MSGQRHTSEATCPTCGNDEAIVRVRGNAFSSVCTSCRRADVSPLLDAMDLVLTEGETMDAELFELEAARCGMASGVTNMRTTQTVIDDSPHIDLSAALSVSMRLPVPPR